MEFTPDRWEHPRPDQIDRARADWGQAPDRDLIDAAAYDRMDTLKDWGMSGEAQASAIALGEEIRTRGLGDAVEALLTSWRTLEAQPVTTESDLPF